MNWDTTLIFGAALACAFSSVVANDECAANAVVQTWPSESPVPIESIPREEWFVHGPDWIVAPNACVASLVAEELDAARARFELRFQPPLTRGAVLGLRHAAQMAALRAAGADWVLPWRFPDPDGDADPLRAALEAQIRSQIEAQLSSDGAMPDSAQVETLMAQALAQLDEKRPAPESMFSEADKGKRIDAIRHEIAHLLFIRELWPNSGQVAERYGGDAPDWLDETAAVLAESEAMTRDRREALIEAVQEGALIPLADYLSMPHPSFGGGAFAAMIEEARANADGSGVIVLSSEDNSIDDAAIGDAALFYTQTRAWIDYLDARTGDARIFASIMNALKAGQSFETWLSERGAAMGLPKDLERLEADFLDWAGSRFDTDT
jgi:hypothetical protein